MTDWIEWHGGEQPVADDVRVDLLLRDGEARVNMHASLCRWTHVKPTDVFHDYDITAYRITQPSELERLRAENARLQEALQAIADDMTETATGKRAFARAALGGQDD